MSRLPLLVAIGILALGSAVLAAPWLTGSVTIPWDAKAHFHAQVQFLANAFATGDTPFWAPQVFAGWPQIADPQSLMFAPAFALLAWLDPAPSFAAVDALVFAHLVAGALGIVLLFRARGWAMAGALVAAFAFAFGGSAMWRVQHTTMVVSLSMLPVALWLVTRALDRRSVVWGAWAGVAVGLLALGRDHVAYLCLLALAIVVADRLFDGRGTPERIRKAMIPLVATGIVTLLVAGGPVLMTWLLAEVSNRPAVTSLDQARGSLHPAALLTIVAGDLFGAAGTGNSFWGPPSAVWHTTFGGTGLFLAQNMGVLYAGAILPLAIVWLGVVRRGLLAREIRGLAIATLVMLLYALGHFTPIYPWLLSELPGASLFRRPADATFVLGALAALLAGYLIHRRIEGTLAPAGPAARIGVVAVALALLGGSLALAGLAGRLEQAWPGVAVAALFGLLAVAMLRFAGRFGHQRPVIVAAALGSLMVADLGWHGRPNGATGLPPTAYEELTTATKDATLALLEERLAAAAAPDRRDRVEFAGVGFHWPNLGLVHGLEHTLGYNPLRLGWYAEATGAKDHIASPADRTFTPLFPSYRSPLADLLGLRFIVSPVPIGEIDPVLGPDDLILIGQTADAYIYENPRAQPRVWFAESARAADFERIARTGTWPTADLSRTVLLEHVPTRGSARTRLASPPPAGQRTWIAEYRNGEVVIGVEADRAGYVVLADVWHPWWRVEIDGRPAELLRANVLFRAVAVEAGRHEIRFSFRPAEGAAAELWEKFERLVAGGSRPGDPG